MQDPDYDRIIHDEYPEHSGCGPIILGVVAFWVVVICLIAL